jgi:hypothetical protein
VFGVVEVVRGTVAAPTALAAVVAWAVAAAAIAVLTAAVSVPAAGGRRPVVLPVWALAVAATLTEVVLLLLDGPWTDRRPTAALARLLVLALAAATAGTLPRWAERLLAGLGVLTVALGAPLAGDLGGLAVAAAVTLVGTGLSVAVLWSLVRRGRPSGAITLGLVVVLAVPAALFAWPEPPPPTHRAHLAVDGTVFDVTVAPVAPGRNELHLYARDPDGRPVDLADVRAQVAGQRAQELFPVTPDHWLSYVLELPDGDRWRLTLTGVGPDGEDHELVLELVAS